MKEISRTGKVTKIEAATDGWNKDKSTLGVTVHVQVEQDYVNPSGKETTATFINQIYIDLGDSQPKVDDVIVMDISWRGADEDHA